MYIHAYLCIDTTQSFMTVLMCDNTYTTMYMHTPKMNNAVCNSGMQSVNLQVQRHMHVGDVAT